MTRFSSELTMITRIVSALSCTAALAIAAPAAAHDLWIDPATFVTRPGALLALRLRVGQDLLGDPVARDAAAIEQFVLVDGDTRQPVAGRDGSDPAGIVRIDSRGVVIVGYRSRPKAVVLPAAKFNDYLREEGLDGVAAARAQRNQSTAEGREIFSRAAKSLVLSDSTTPSGADRAIGLRLELVAEANPYSRPAGEDLPIRLLFENQGLPGALVVAINRRDPTAKVTARTDASGRVRLKLSRGGMWLVKAVHMVAAPAGSGADWESIWASLTFDLNPAPKVSASK
jgi:uncharacterized GH25 family protein